MIKEDIGAIIICTFMAALALWVVMQFWSCVVNACRPIWGFLGL